MNPILSTALLVLIVILAWGFVLNLGLPAIEKTTASVDMSDAESSMKILGNYIDEVASEGYGSTRIFKMKGGELSVISEENSIEFKTETNAVEYLSRVISGNIIRIAGSDVNCYEEDINNDGTNELILENSFLKIGFQKVSKTPSQSINTARNIVYMKEKTGNSVILPTNSSIVINDIESTSSGNGYSEILRPGFAKPLCTVHFFVNSTIRYDIYYTLYAGADFLVIDVKTF